MLEESRLDFTVVEDSLIASHCYLQDRGEGWVSLEEVYTLPEHRGKGLARQVCLKALEYAKNKNLNVWVIATPIFDYGPDAKSLAIFYESLGFVVTRIDEHRYFLELRYKQ